MMSNMPPAISHGGKGDINDALSKVARVCDISLSPDPSPNIHIGPVTFEYAADLDARFNDRNSFKAALKKYLEEAEDQAKMIKLVEQAYDFACMFYTWRSCSMAMPKNLSVENYPVALEVLEPEIQKLKDFMAFQKEAIGQFKKELGRLCVQKKEFVSEAYLLTFGKFISMLATLDELKNIKASIMNDFTYYKRVMERIRRTPDVVTDLQEMTLFLANHNSILTSIKAVFSSINDFEDVICNIIIICVSWYDQKQFLLPEEKYTIVKMIGFFLYLIDSERVNVNKLSKLNLKRIDAIFKDVEVVPLFGDMMIGPFNYVQKMKNYDPDNWPKCTSSSTGSQLLLVSQMPTNRQRHTEVICEFLLSIPGSLTESAEKKKKVFEEHSIPLERATAVYNVTVKCLHVLASWTTSISEMFSWKLIHPAEPSEKKFPAEAEMYERATRYNYSKAEKDALAELIGLIKDVQSLIKRNERYVQRAINTHIYHKLQEFVQCGLAEPLRKAEKHNKEIIRSTLDAVQKICQDFNLQDVTTKNLKEKTLTGKKKKAECLSEIQISAKTVHPSFTQLYLVRTMLESLVEKGDKASHRKSPRKDMEATHVKVIEEFLQSSFIWSYVMNLHWTLESCCNLAQLWYREFYLEMTRGDKIQFPIEMSMPWILTEHILEKKDPYLTQYVLYPLDLYNDSAQCALRHFKRQFLYDEIEAEAMLSFDQFVYKLSEDIYSYYRLLASTIVLNKTFKCECKNLGMKFPSDKVINYVPLMQQRNIQMLGRTVDLQHLIAQRINGNLLKSMNVAIGRYESMGITGIMELEGLLKITQETHKLLGQHLRLDSFEALLNEANHSISSPYGRIVLYTLLELNDFVAPQFCYNSSTNRFVKTVLPFVDEIDRGKPLMAAACHLYGNKQLLHCYSAIYSQYRNFIGDPHFFAVVGVMGYQDIAFILKELTSNLKSLIQNRLLPYLGPLQNVMPRRCILPRYEYTSPGVLGYFLAQLGAIVGYTELQTKVFQSLREIGNATLIALKLELAMSIKESNELVISGMFQHVIPRPFVDYRKADPKKYDEEIKKKTQNLELKYRHLNVQAIICGKGTQEQMNLCKENCLLSREKLSSALYMFGPFLKNIGSCLKNDPVWSSLSTVNGAWNVEGNVEFWRLWSAMYFVICRPPGQNEFTVEELFGEGLQWGGCVLVFLLGQQRRFEAMDFCYHLLKTHKVDHMDQICEGVSLKKMVNRIRKFQILNDQVYSILNKYIHAGKDKGAPDYGVTVEEFTTLPSGKTINVNASSSTEA